MIAVEIQEKNSGAISCLNFISVHIQLKYSNQGTKPKVRLKYQCYPIYNIIKGLIADLALKVIRFENGAVKLVTVNDVVEKTSFRKYNLI